MKTSEETALVKLEPFLFSSFKTSLKDLAWCGHFDYDLSLHAAEDEGKTEEPTERRKKKAKEEEGRVFLTQEIPQSIVVFVVFSLVALMSGYYLNEFREYFILYLYNPNQIEISKESIEALFFKNIIFFLKIMLPVGVVAILSVVLATMIQTKFHVSTKNLKLDFSRVAISWNNFIKKTIFSRTQVFNLIKSYFKIFIVGIICYFFIVFRFEEIILLIQGEVLFSLVKASQWTFQFVSLTLVFFLMIAIPDWFIQRAEYLEQLKMSKEDIKEEMKELEGNPEIKQRQKERARELANRNMLKEARNADVVITNPTHYACALSYDPFLMNAPKLLAKGIDLMAQKIKQIAKEEGILIVENKPLARGLYNSVDVNDYIPPDFYAAVAELLSILNKYKRN